jgi:phosphotransferase system enzyme I (PtsP)
MDAQAAATGTRRLLRRLRDVMAGAGSAQDRLDTIVRIIAGEMVAEVCSAYVLRAGDILELFATEGLKQEAVHQTRLRVGEGLVGVIAATARPLALADAQSHPSFAYRPETGEEIYRSLMGVPVLRGGRVTGVLVVQNRTQRHYTEDEIETMQTVAMVLAELIASGELVSPEEQHPTEGIGLLPVRLEGTCLNGGLACGVAVLHGPRIVLRHVVAEDPQAELQRLRAALEAMRTQIDDLIESSDLQHGGEHRDILETYRMFATDRGWIGRMTEAVRGGLTAEAAVQKVTDDMRVRMKAVSDPYLRERLMDLEDLANRLLHQLAGRATTVSEAELPQEFILIARSMGPAELLDYDRRRLKGVLLEEGSPTSHVAIVAGALDIPVVGRISELLSKVEAGDLVVVDADHAQAFVRPGEDIMAAVEANLRARAAQQAEYAAMRDLPAVTADGVAVSLQLNCGLQIDMAHLDRTGAEGVGLFRTELPFMVRNTMPTVDQQQSLYAAILDAAGGRPVTFRTLDIGGDKLLPYLVHGEDENPAMGWRAIRVSLDRPAMLRQQLRALVRAGNGRPMRIMFPMVAEVAELEQARAVLGLEIDRACMRGLRPPEPLQVGVMIEVPSLVWQLPALLKRVDFVSVGTNDLAQFFFAADRGNPRLAGRYDTLSPGFLRLLGEIAAQAAAAGVPATVCGEMAGQPLEAMALVGLGYRNLSMAPGAVGPVKKMIRSLTLSPLEVFLRGLLDSPDHSLRQKLLGFARDHAVDL